MKKKNDQYFIDLAHSVWGGPNQGKVDELIKKYGNHVPSTEDIFMNHLLFGRKPSFWQKVKRIFK